MESVGLGRRIFDNIKKAISYTLSVHIPIIVSLLPLFLKLPLILSFFRTLLTACSIYLKQPAESTTTDTKESIFIKKLSKGV